MKSYSNSPQLQGIRMGAVEVVEASFQSQGRRIQGIRTTGNGSPLLLMHGVTRRWQSFLPILPSLSFRWQVSAFDFRGHGQSDRNPGGYRVMDYADDIVDFLQQWEEGPVVLYGHSLGSMVAAAVAARVPNQVRALILEDPPWQTMGIRIRSTPLYSYFAGMHALAGSRKRLIELAADVAELEFLDPLTGDSQRVGDLRDAASLRFTAACLRQLDPDVFTSIVEARWLEGYDVTEIWRSIPCPTLLLQADPRAGGMLSDTDAEAMQCEISDMTRVRFAGSGHGIHWLQTQTLLNVVQGFLESLGDENRADR